MAGSDVQLRPLQLDDAHIFVRWRADPSFRDPLLGYRFPVTDEMEETWVTSAMNDQSRSRIVMAIEDGDKRLVGFVQLHGIDWIDRTAELAVAIGEPSDRGKGRGEAATRLILGEAFRTYGLRRVYVRVAAFNDSAQKMFRKLNFQHEGTLRQHVFRNETCHDVFLFGMLEEEAADVISSGLKEV